MMTLQERLAAELEQQVDRLPARSGDLQRVRRVGGRRLLVARVVSFAGVAAAAFVVTAAVVLLQGQPNETVVTSGSRVVFEDGYALSPFETATMLVDCLQERGLDVVQSGNAIDYDNRVVADDDFELGVAECQTKLRLAGFLLPGDNPEYLEVLYAQFQALADCYRDAGIEISEAPDIDTFIDARQAGDPAWSPQAEAIRQVGSEETAQAERGCNIPTPEQVMSND